MLLTFIIFLTCFFKQNNLAILPAWPQYIQGPYNQLTNLRRSLGLKSKESKEHWGNSSYVPTAQRRITSTPKQEMLVRLPLRVYIPFSLRKYRQNSYVNFIRINCTFWGNYTNIKRKHLLRFEYLKNYLISITDIFYLFHQQITHD